MVGKVCSVAGGGHLGKSSSTHRLVVRTVVTLQPFAVGSTHVAFAKRRASVAFAMLATHDIVAKLSTMVSFAAEGTLDTVTSFAAIPPTAGVSTLRRTALMSTAMSKTGVCTVPRFTICIQKGFGKKRRRKPEIRGGKKKVLLRR